MKGGREGGLGNLPVAHAFLEHVGLELGEDFFGRLVGIVDIAEDHHWVLIRFAYGVEIQ